MNRQFKILLTSICLLWPAAGWAADEFVIEFTPGTYSANDYVGVTINAFTGGFQDPAYTGSVDFSATRPGVNNVRFDPPSSGNFVSGAWVGHLQFFTAGAITLSCQDGSATGNSMVAISAAWPNDLLVLLPGQTYTPGYYPGVSPMSNELYFIEGVKRPVTIYVTDVFYNWDANYADADGTTIYASMGGNGTATPGQVFTQNGRAFMELAFTSPGQNTYTLRNYVPDAFSTTIMPHIQDSDTVYTYSKVPTQVVAGELFGVTFTASNLPGYNPYAEPPEDPQVVASVNGESFSIERYPYGSTTTTAQGTWLPGADFQIATPYQGMNPGDGRYFAEYSYDRAEDIMIQCNADFGGTPAVYPRLSRKIEVLPNEPHALRQPTISPQIVQSKSTATISVVVEDEYGNPTRSSLYPFVVTFDITQGQGTLSATQASTNDSGVAQCQYTAAKINEEITVAVAAVNSMTSTTYDTRSLTFRVSVAPATRGAITNHPNPFNPVRNQTTSINYYLEQNSDVEIRIYDPFGRLVLSEDYKKDDGDAIARSATMGGGAAWEWDGRNGEGKIVGNGIYFLKITARSSAGAQEFKRRVGVLK